MWDEPCLALAGGLGGVGSRVRPTLDAQVAVFYVDSVLAGADAGGAAGVGVGAFWALSAHSIKSGVSADTLAVVVPPDLVGPTYTIALVAECVECKPCLALASVLLEIGPGVGWA